MGIHSFRISQLLQSLQLLEKKVLFATATSFLHTHTEHGWSCEKTTKKSSLGLGNAGKQQNILQHVCDHNKTPVRTRHYVSLRWQWNNLQNMFEVARKTQRAAMGLLYSASLALVRTIWRHILKSEKSCTYIWPQHPISLCCCKSHSAPAAADVSDDCCRHGQFFSWGMFLNEILRWPEATQLPNYEMNCCPPCPNPCLLHLMDWSNT